MKIRVVVMNGQRLVQSEAGGKWSILKVGKACGLRPAVYNISTAAAPQPGETYHGLVVHVDDHSVYQEVGNGFVQHPREQFAREPIIGSRQAVSYEPPAL